MYFLLAPVNGILVVSYILYLHLNYLLVIALMIGMGVLEWKERRQDLIQDERRIV